MSMVYDWEGKEPLKNSMTPKTDTPRSRKVGTIPDTPSTTNGSPVQGTTAHYLPYGDYRGSAPTATPLTERGYTSHHENREIGLTYMNARFYSPTSGRFLTADTIVPDPADPQSANRYAYVLGNPLKLVDPTGHCGADPRDSLTEQCVTLRTELEEYFKVTIEGIWTYLELAALRLAMGDIEAGLGGIVLFHTLFAGTKISRVRQSNVTDARTPWRINVGDDTFAQNNLDEARWTIIHEFGHIWDARSWLSLSRRFEERMGGSSTGCLVELLGGCSYDPGTTPLSEYGNNNRREDWADSFAAAMFGGNWDNLGRHGHRINPERLTVVQINTSPRVLFVQGSISWLHTQVSGNFQQILNAHRDTPLVCITSYSC